MSNATNESLELVYKHGEHNFYAHKNPLEISPIRGIAIERARRFVDMNIREKNLKELIAEIKKTAGAGDIVKAFSIVQEIEYRLNFISEETSILEFVCIYYLLDDEDPKKYNPSITEKKMKLFEDNSEMRAFFLDIGLNLIDKFTKLPEVDLKSYMAENQANADRIYRFISRNMSKDSKTT